MNNQDGVISEINLKGKIALVTGGSKGIGQGVALALAKRGADIIVISRRQSEAQQVADQIMRLGNRAQAYSVDVSSREQVAELFAKQVPEFGGVDIFVNNAGVTAMKHLLETTPEEVDRIIDTNLKGAINCLTAASKLMVQQRRGGNIVIVTSINGLWPLPSQAVYTSTKAALEALMRCLAADLAPQGIRVNSVAPGAIYTDMNYHFTPEVVREVNALVPMGRIGESAEIGEVVAFLVSGAASYITGSTIVADGGFMLRR